MADIGLEVKFNSDVSEVNKDIGELEGRLKSIRDGKIKITDPSDIKTLDALDNKVKGLLSAISKDGQILKITPQIDGGSIEEVQRNIANLQNETMERVRQFNLKEELRAKQAARKSNSNISSDTGARTGIVELREAEYRFIEQYANRQAMVEIEAINKVKEAAVRAEHDKTQQLKAQLKERARSRALDTDIDSKTGVRAGIKGLSIKETETGGQGADIIKQQNLRRAASESNRENIHKDEQAYREAASNVNNITKDIYRVAAQIISLKVFKDMAMNAIDLNGALEITIAQFEALTGDMDYARGLVTEMQHLADTTVFGTDELLGATKQLELYGINGTEQMNNIANAAAIINPAKIEEMATWMGKLASGENTGEAISALSRMGLLTRTMMETEGIQFNAANKLLSTPDEAIAAANKIIAERFEDGIEKTQDTWQGTVSTLEDTIAVVTRESTTDVFQMLNKDVAGLLDELESKLASGEMDATINKINAGLMEGYELVKGLAQTGVEMVKIVKPLTPLLKPLLTMLIAKQAVEGVDKLGSAVTDTFTTISGLAGKLGKAKTEIAGVSTMAQAAGAIPSLINPATLAITALAVGLTAVASARAKAAERLNEFKEFNTKETESLRNVDKLKDRYEELASTVGLTNEQQTELKNVTIELEDELGLSSGTLTSLSNDYGHATKEIDKYIEAKQKELDVQIQLNKGALYKDLYDTKSLEKARKVSEGADKSLKGLMATVVNIFRSEENKTTDRDMAVGAEILESELIGTVSDIIKALDNETEGLIRDSTSVKWATDMANRMFEDQMLMGESFNIEVVKNTIKESAESLGELGIADTVAQGLVKDFQTGFITTSELINQMEIDIDMRTVDGAKFNAGLLENVNASGSYLEITEQIRKTAEDNLNLETISANMKIAAEKRLSTYDNNLDEANSIKNTIETYKDLIDAKDKTKEESRQLELNELKLEAVLERLGLGHLSVAEAVREHGDEIQKLLDKDADKGYEDFIESANEIRGQIKEIEGLIKEKQQLMRGADEETKKVYLQSIEQLKGQIGTLNQTYNDVINKSIEVSEKAAADATRRREETERKRIEKAKEGLEDRLAESQGKYDRGDQGLSDYKEYMDARISINQQIALLEDESIRDTEKRLTDEYNLRKGYQDKMIEIEKQAISEKEAIAKGSYDRSAQAPEDFKVYMQEMERLENEMLKIEKQSASEREKVLTERFNREKQYADMLANIRRQEAADYKAMVQGAYDRSDQSNSQEGLNNLNEYIAGVKAANKQIAGLGIESVQERESRLTEEYNLDKQFGAKWLEIEKEKIDNAFKGYEVNQQVVESKIQANEQLLEHSRKYNNIEVGLLKELESTIEDLREEYKRLDTTLEDSRAVAEGQYARSRQTIEQEMELVETLKQLNDERLKNESMSETERQGILTETYDKEKGLFIRMQQQKEKAADREFALSDKTTEAYQKKLQVLEEISEAYRESTHITEDELETVVHKYEDFQRELENLSKPVGHILEDVSGYYETLSSVFERQRGLSYDNVLDVTNTITTQETITLDINVNSTGTAIDEEGVNKITSGVIEVGRDLFDNLSTYSPKGGVNRVR